MLVTAGIGVSLIAARSIERVRFAADAFYYNLEAPTDLDSHGMLIAAIYGLCLTLFILAIRTGDFWISPGKTLALLFATMCILNWSLEFIAGTVTHFRMQTDLDEGAVDNRGIIFGTWYRDFAVHFGYIASLPVLLWVIFKSKHQALFWRLAWTGFLLFSLLIIGYIHFEVQSYFDPQLAFWYFEMAIGIPICLLIGALVISFIRGDEVDWWTTMTTIPVIAAWLIGVTTKYIAQQTP
ncbi:MAG TPA: hypothetical protein DDZ51_26250 [Planctomycetaceae bacterium]|nr:hypothetical protein [Planctomycetaceae bacterium]